MHNNLFLLNMSLNNLLLQQFRAKKRGLEIVVFARIQTYILREKKTYRNG